MKHLARLIMWFWGWRYEKDNHVREDKCIVIAAPHTSNWDFILDRLFYWAAGGHMKFIIKKESFKGPMGIFLKAIGGVPIDRSAGLSVLESTVELIKNSKHIHLLITPEGTRKKTKRWKRGFIHIAKKAGVNVYISKYDWKEKWIKIEKEPFQFTGNDDEDMKRVLSEYVGINGKNPEYFATGLEDEANG